MIKYLLPSLLILLPFKFIRAQNPIGLPEITNYSNADYKAGMQNWDIDQDINGILYFANNDGLLSYNGRYWNIYPLPNKSVVRSVEIDAEGRIFVGGQDEIGYFFPDKNGILKYHSLKSLLSPSDQKFADIWNIIVFKDEVFFRSTSKVFQYKGGRIHVFNPGLEWVFLGTCANRVFLQERKKGLMVFQDGNWKLIEHQALPEQCEISAILPYKNDTLLITTLKNGLFLLSGSTITPIKTAEDSIFYNERIYCATPVNNEWYAFGSTSAGLFIVDKQFRIQQKFAYEEGLQKDNIRSVFIDHNSNLWLGLDDGIDLITINSAIKHIYPDEFKQVSSYAINIFNHHLYIGTSNGLFSTPLQNVDDLSYSKGSFSEVQNTQGQVWSLQEINNQLLMAHEDGAYVIRNNFADKIYTAPGTWLFRTTTPLLPSENIIAGTYWGLNLIQYKAGKFTNVGPINGIFDALRFVIIDHNTSTVWASHPIHGIFKMDLSADYKKVLRVKLFTRKDGLPGDLNNYVYRIKNRIVIATDQGIYEYNSIKNNFEPSVFFNPIFKKMPVKYMREDNDGNIWFVSNNKIGVVDFHQTPDNKNFSIVYLPELTGKVVGGFESIYPFNRQNIFIAATKGVIHVNYQKYNQNTKSLNVILGLIKLTGPKDSLLFGGYFTSKGKLAARQDAASIPSLSHRYNSLHFEYSSSLFEQKNITEYSYRLVGFDKDWSAWSDKSEKDYTNLGPGEYTFMVKARNNLGGESEAVSYTFKVLPAWYQSYWSYLIYVLILSGGIYLAFRWQKKKHIKQQERLKYLHQLELDRNEKEIVKLKNEKLEADVNFKNKELATTTMHLVQRGKVLSKIKEELISAGRKLDETSASELKRVLRLLNEVEKSDADWDQFAIHFDHVHSNFISILKEKFPELTPNELKLCAYLKMSLTSKEIAQLMNITIRAVEVSRYRLRKKLNLASDVNLFDFLIQVTGK